MVGGGEFRSAHALVRKSVRNGLIASGSLALFGTEEQEPPAVLLRAGPLSLCLQGTRLRALEVDGYEVLHGVALTLGQKQRQNL